MSLDPVTCGCLGAGVGEAGEKNANCCRGVTVATTLISCGFALSIIMCSTSQCYGTPDKFNKHTCEMWSCSLAWQVPFLIFSGLATIFAWIVVCKSCK